MKRSLKKLIGYSIEALDGVKGKVKDFLFDEENWAVKYLEVDLGSVLPAKKVLIPKTLLKQPDWSTHQFAVELTKSDIEKSPPLEEHLPVSKKYEKELNSYYDSYNKWLYYNVPPIDSAVVVYPPRPLTVPTKILHENELDTVLRSFNEVKGYHIKALDGRLGHLDDVIIDDIDWQIVYVVVDTSDWFPWSKKVLISMPWLNKISYLNREISINLHIASIKSAPEFNPSTPINEKYEMHLYDYYGRPVVHL